MAEDFNIPLGFQDNTGPAEQGFGRISAITKQIRSDIEAIVTGVAGISDRADTMREYWQDNVELVQRMKSVLDIVGTTISTNQTSLTNNLTQINEILSQVKGLGGNTAQALQMLSMAGGGFGGGQYGGVGQYLNSIGNQGPLASQMFQASNASSDYTLTNPLSPSGMQQIEQGTYQGDNPYGNMGTPQARQRGASRGRRTDLGSDEVSLSGAASAEAYLPTNNTSARSTYQDQIRAQINRYPNISKKIPTGQEDSAAQLAYQYSTRQVEQLLGNSALGRQLNKRFQTYLGSTGVTPDALRTAQQEATIHLNDANGPMYQQNPVTGKQEAVMGRNPDQGFSTVEAAAMKIADTISSVLSSKVGGTMITTAGRVGKASAIYGGAQDIMGQVRQVTGYAQQQGQLSGMTSYSRSAGLGLQAYINSGFNLNSKYSTQDYMNAQNMGMGLGLKGAALTEYAKNAMQMKGNFGFNGQQTQGLVGAGLAVGVSQQSNLAGITAERKIAQTTPNTSTAYTDLAYTQGMQTAAQQGLGGNAAAQAGVTASQFGAGNLVAQSQGMTGTEGAGSTLMNALMAQQLGTSYTGLGAKLQNTSNAAYQKAMNASEEEILGWAQINVKAKYKDEKDFKKKNGNQIGVLQLILQGLPDAAHQKIGASWQSTETWAWSILQKQKQLDTKPKKQGSMIANAFGSIEHAVKGTGNFLHRATADVLNATVAPIYDAAKAAAIGGISAYDFVSGQSEETNTKRIKGVTGFIDRNTQHGGEELLHDSASLVKNATTSAARLVSRQLTGSPAGASTLQSMAAPQHVTVSVDMHPSIKSVFNASVKNGTAGFNSGQVPPNAQPTRTLAS